MVLVCTSGSADNAEASLLVSNVINAFAGEYDGVAEYQAGRGDFPGDPAWTSREGTQSGYERRIIGALESARISESVVTEWRWMCDYWISATGPAVNRIAEILIGPLIARNHYELRKVRSMPNDEKKPSPPIIHDAALEEEMVDRYEDGLLRGIEEGIRLRNEDERKAKEGESEKPAE